MPTYMIVTAKVSDRQAFLDGYARAAGALVERFGGRYILRGSGAQRLEGEFGDSASMVISEWPNKQTALSFWNSPEYRDVKMLREGIAECQVLLIEAPQVQ